VQTLLVIVLHETLRNCLTKHAFPQMIALMWSSYLLKKYKTTETLDKFRRWHRCE